MKNIAIACAGLVFVVSQANLAAAKTLEEVLKEKGVISEADYNDIMRNNSASSSLNYKLGNGFTFSTNDDRFRLSIDGMIQVRYDFVDLDDVNNSAAKSAQDVSKFQIKRAKMNIQGHAITKNLTYLLVLAPSNMSGGTTPTNSILDDVFVNYRLLNELQFTGGQFKTQFGREWLVSSRHLQFVDQNHVTSAFIPSYDTGVRVHGAIADGMFTYSLEGTGGAGYNTVRATKDNAFAARLTCNPFGTMKNTQPDLEYSEKPLLSLGSSYYFNTIRKGETTNQNFIKSSGWFGMNTGVQKFTTGEAIEFNMFACDAAFKWQGLSISGEYMFGEADGASSQYKQRAQGFYGQAGYFILLKQLELAYRYAYLDPNRDLLNDHWVENTVGVNWYFAGHNVKLQADFTKIHKQAAIASTSGSKPTDDNQARIQLQVLF